MSKDGSKGTVTRDQRANTRAAKKEADYTTITIPKREYQKLVNLKEELGKRSDYSWVAGLGLGAFIGLMIGFMATATKRSIVTCGSCGTQVDITELKQESFQCPNCGRLFLKPPQR
jgi:DNA-directed RNA polymerase subunit RPC12/RpoP